MKRLSTLVFLAGFLALSTVNLTGCSKCSCGGDKSEADNKGYVKLKPKRSAYDKDYIRNIKVKKVLDGRTIILEDGEKVVMVGIDLPEVASDHWAAAKELTKLMAEGQEISMMVCPGKPFDYEGNTQAHVFKGTDTPMTIAEDLIREGLARVRITPPCGGDKISIYNRLLLQARSQMKGLWRAEVMKGREDVKAQKKKVDATLEQWRKSAERSKKIIDQRRKRRAGLGGGLVPMRNFEESPEEAKTAAEQAPVAVPTAPAAVPSAAPEAENAAGEAPASE
jgi:Staphylococcal nuclease homologue